MQLLDFSQIIERNGLPLKKSRLCRHDDRGLQLWRLDPRYFDHYVSFQRGAGPSPFQHTTFAFHFFAGPRLENGDHTALFVRAHRIVGERRWRDESHFALHAPDAALQPNEDDRVYDLERLEDFDQLSQRVLIRWGNGALAWSQWAHTNPKEVLELRLDAYEPPFPGFSNFTATRLSIATLPRSWAAALASVKGVYLLVCPETGEQYVGSASGEDGFMGRWREYASNGHGGDKLLMARPASDYAISILEVASPDMSRDDIIRRESAWKLKLGSRAHGLNAN